MTGNARVWQDNRSGERRRRKSFVVLERRSGFDRRVPTGTARRAGSNALRELRDDPVVLLLLLAATNVLNLLDQLATTRALAAGFSEANPLMAALIGFDPGIAAAVKVLVVLAVTASVWALRRYRVVLQVAVFVFAMFAAVLLWHYYGATLY